MGLEVACVLNFQQLFKVTLDIVKLNICGYMWNVSTVCIGFMFGVLQLGTH